MHITRFRMAFPVNIGSSAISGSLEQDGCSSGPWGGLICSPSGFGPHPCAPSGAFGERPCALGFGHQAAALHGSTNCRTDKVKGKKASLSSLKA